MSSTSRLRSPWPGQFRYAAKVLRRSEAGGGERVSDSLHMMLGRMLGREYRSSPKYAVARENLLRIEAALSNDFELLRGNPTELQTRARNTNASPIELDLLSDSEHPMVRKEVAANKSSPNFILRILAKDSDPEVSDLALRHLRKREARFKLKRR